MMCNVAGLSAPVEFCPGVSFQSASIQSKCSDLADDYDRLNKLQADILLTQTFD
jgi:hypothetical protein